MDEFKKGRFSFSLTPALVLVGEEIVEERSKQTEELNAELETYGIILRDLTCDNISYELRNEILNIAMFIRDNAEIYNMLYEKKELPMKRLSKAILKPKQYLQKWRDYIIVYSIILGNYNYKYISDYLKIIEKRDEQKESKNNNVISFNNIANLNENDNENIEENNESNKDYKENNVNIIDEHEKIKGIILYKRKSKAIILTSSGDFKSIKVDEGCKLGEEVSSTVKKKIKNLKIYIGILILFILSGLSIGVYRYFRGITTIIFEADQQITLEVNSFDRVVRSKNISMGKADTDILEIVEVQDRDIDAAIYKLIKYCNEENEISRGQILITVTGDAIKHGVLSNTREYVSKEGINVKFNNAGYESSLSN